MDTIETFKKVMDLAPQFIKHFDKIYTAKRYDKIYNNTDSKLIGCWVVEMQAWLNAVLAIRLSGTNRPLSLQQKIEWFFSCGSDSETLFPGNPTEAEVYDDFVDLLAINNNVEASLIELGLR